MSTKNQNLEEAILLFTLGQTAKALEFVQAIIEDEPHSIDAWRALAEIQLSENNVREAEVACLRALEIDSSDLTSTVTLACVYWLKKEIKKEQKMHQQKLEYLAGRMNLHNKTRIANLRF